MCSNHGLCGARRAAVAAAGRQLGLGLNATLVYAAAEPGALLVCFAVLAAV